MKDFFDDGPGDSFDEFWALYPRKTAKGAARKAYAKAMKLVYHNDLMHALSQQVEGMKIKDPKFIPHASTWLNQERWEDDPEQPDSADQINHAGGGEIAFAASFNRSPGRDCF